MFCEEIEILSNGEPLPTIHNGRMWLPSDCLLEVTSSVPNASRAIIHFVRRGWTFVVQTTSKSAGWRALTITIAAARPAVAKDGTTRGLLGRYDGNRENDLTTSNETVLPSSSSVGLYIIPKKLDNQIKYKALFTVLELKNKLEL